MEGARTVIAVWKKRDANLAGKVIIVEEATREQTRHLRAALASAAPVVCDTAWESFLTRDTIKS